MESGLPFNQAIVGAQGQLTWIAAAGKPMKEVPEDHPESRRVEFPLSCLLLRLAKGSFVWLTQLNLYRYK